MSRIVIERGARWTRVLAAGTDRPHQERTPAGSLAPYLRRLLTRIAPPATAPLTVVVPDTWLDGSPLGIARHERFQRELTSAGFTEPSWYGTCPAVAAYGAREHGSGTYLVCDFGWSGASLGLCEVHGDTIRVMATLFEPGAGAAAYARAVTERFPPAVAERFADVQAEKADRARAVLSRTTDGHGDDPVYVFDGVVVDANLLVSRFDPLAELLRRRISELTGEPTSEPGQETAGRYDTVLVSGGFGDFPLVERALPGPVHRLGVNAAVGGASLLDQRVFTVARPERTEWRLDPSLPFS